MVYNVYQGDDLIAEKVEGKEYTVSGLTPNTEYSFSVSEVIGEEESEKATVTVTTLPIKVTGVTLAPKTSNAESGIAGERQVTATVAPANATNKNVTYSIAPQTTGLTISGSGLIKWTADVPAGEYTTTVKTVDGNKTDTHKLTLTEPAPPEE
jgi:uncharacterized protein YjdB